jgi:glycosyltransferase involved in cell wall biosynthesis
MSASSQKPMRACIIQNIISPYRIPLFGRIARHEGIELTVVYCAATERRRQWTVPEALPFRSVLLKGRSAVSRSVELSRMLAHERFDVVISGGSITLLEANVAAWIGSLTRTPTGFFWEGNLAKRAYAQWARDVVKAALLRAFDFFVVPGYGSWDHLRALGVDAGTLFVAPNSVDHDSWARYAGGLRPQRSDLRRELGVRDRVVVYVGRLAPEKRVDRVIACFRQVGGPDCSLLLVGDGPERSRLVAQAGGDERIVFAGFREGEELAKCYVVADAHVLASATDPWGLVVNEAAACGVPSIVTDRVGAREMIVSGVSGLVVRETDEAVGRAIEWSLANPDACAEMGRAATLIAGKGYHPAAQAQGFVEALLAHRAGPRL